MLSRDPNERRKLMNELFMLPRWIRDNADNIELGSHWTDLTTAAALLSRTAYMPHGKPLMDHEYPPASLKAIIRKLDASGRVFVIYMIAGDPGELRRRRFLYLGGCLFVHPLERLAAIDKLVGIYLEAKEVAASFGRQTDRGNDDEIKRNAGRFTT